MHREGSPLQVQHYNRVSWFQSQVIPMCGTIDDAFVIVTQNLYQKFNSLTLCPLFFLFAQSFAFQTSHSRSLSPLLYCLGSRSRINFTWWNSDVIHLTNMTFLPCSFSDRALRWCTSTHSNANVCDFYLPARCFLFSSFRLKLWSHRARSRVRVFVCVLAFIASCHNNSSSVGARRYSYCKNASVSRHAKKNIALVSFFYFSHSLKLNSLASSGSVRDTSNIVWVCE